MFFLKFYHAYYPYYIALLDLDFANNISQVFVFFLDFGEKIGRA